VDIGVARPIEPEAGGNDINDRTIARRRPTTSGRSDEIEGIVRRLARPLSRLSRLIYRASDSSLPRGMRNVLFALSSEPLRMSEIAQQEGIHQSVASRMVASLEAIGLVRRERGASDGRVVIVSLTERGVAELDVLREQSWSVLRDVLMNCNPKELRALKEASETLELLGVLLEERGIQGSSSGWCADERAAGQER
jgi:DNA-binding MarR family transcriptional regulator